MISKNWKSLDLSIKQFWKLFFVETKLNYYLKNKYVSNTLMKTNSLVIKELLVLVHNIFQEIGSSSYFFKYVIHMHFRFWV
jgi:hypothetical protein